MLSSRQKLGRLILVLVLLSLSLPGHAGLSLRYYPKAGNAPTVANWPQTVLESNIIVEVRLSPSVADAFTVTRSHHGSLKNGAKLLFQDCAPIMMDTEGRESLRDLLRAPVVDHVLPDDTLPVDEVNALARMPVPSREARYIFAIARSLYEGRHFWRFTMQTVGGDLLLIQDNRVYIPVLVAGWDGQKHSRHLRHVWVPHPYTPRAQDLQPVLRDEVAFKNEFLRVSRLKNKEKRIQGLRRYITPPIGRQSMSVYPYRAIEAIAASGAIGTAYLREQSATPPLASYLSFIIVNQYQQHDRAALPWLRQHIQQALNHSAALPWPKRYCDFDTEASRASIVFLCQGAQALAALGDDQAVPLIRASIAWQLAQGRDWWSNAVPFTLDEKQTAHAFRSKPVPESDPLIMMTRVIMNDPLFRPYPSLNEDRTRQLRRILRNWAAQYRHEAIPGLLWIWAQDQDPDVLGDQRGIRPRLAREALQELLDRDLGAEAMPYWQWYLEHVLNHGKPVPSVSP